MDLVDEFIAFGVGLDTAIKTTVLGLLTRGKHVLLVRDAIDCDDSRKNEITLRKMEAKGAQLISTDELTGISRLKGQTSNRRPWHNALLTHARVG